MEEKPAKKIIISNKKGQQFAGAEACRNCHREIYDSSVTTMHHLSSGIASKDYIKGSFAEGKNTFLLNDSMKVFMEERAGGLFQVSYINGKQERSEPFDIVIGSGKKGQSYLYWNDRELYQLPVSNFAAMHVWANSPGFPRNKIFFDRNIEGRCLECHTTFAKETVPSEYNPKQIIYGIDCERCHGPGAKHIEFHVQNPQEKQGRFIVNPASLNRQQRLDVCALCHSGVMENKNTAFSFFPGDTLSKYFVRNSSGIDSFNLDVHANQYGLLTASKCFRISGTMNCSTCHNTHAKENGNLIAYGQKCMNCHTPGDHNFCTFQPEPGFSMVANCVNCHMPVGASKNLTLLISGQATTSPEMVRTHLIAIYRNNIKPWLKKNK